MMPFKDLREGMRLESTGDVSPGFKYVTVTRVDRDGNLFEYELDADVYGWPRAGERALRRGHIRYIHYNKVLTYRPCFVEPE